MKELEYVLEERKLLQEKYFADTKQIWIEYEGLEADKRHRKVISSYKHKDKFLEQLQARLESCIEDINYYDEKMKG